MIVPIQQTIDKILSDDKPKMISGFPDYYITKEGRVWSNKRCRGKISGWLKPQELNHKHLSINLCKKGKVYQYQIHRLVLETFVGPCPPGMEACHNNGNGYDNRLKNLRWDTRENNHKDMIKHGTYSPPPILRGEKNNHNVLKEEQVKLIFHAYHDGIYNSQELANYFNVDRTTISKIITKKNWGWLWNI